MSRESPQLEALFAQNGLEGMVEQASLISIGGLAMNGSAASQSPYEDPRMVLLCASHGGTAKQIGRLLNAPSPSTVTKVGASLMRAYDVPTMAAVVDRSIISGDLPVANQDNTNPRLSKKPLIILNGYANGASNGEIGRQLGLTKFELNSLCLSLFRLIIANGRTHSVRRAYELAVFPRFRETA